MVAFYRENVYIAEEIWKFTPYLAILKVPFYRENIYLAVEIWKFTYI